MKFFVDLLWSFRNLNTNTNSVPFFGKLTCVFCYVGGRSCPYDYVKVYRGNTTDNAALLRTVCGSYVPSLLYARSSLTLEFITDGSVIDQGWRAYFNTSCKLFIK